jgi:hypothetical protein
MIPNRSVCGSDRYPLVARREVQERYETCDVPIRLLINMEEGLIDDMERKVVERFANGRPRTSASVTLTTNNSTHNLSMIYNF